MTAPPPSPLDAVDLAAGLAVAGLRAGGAVARTLVRPAKLAARAPVVGPRLQRAAAELQAELRAEGRMIRAEGRAQLEAVVNEVLEAPEVERTIDHALAGPLTEALGRSLAEHRVVERLAGELIATGAIEDALTAALEHEATQRLLEQVLSSPGLERMLVATLESRIVPELTDRLLRSPEMQAVLEYVMTSPELRRALTQQGSSLADEMVDGLRSRTESLDDRTERTVRGWLRRPRPAPGA